MRDLIERQAAIDALAENMPSTYTPDGSHPADEGIFMVQEIYADCIQTLKELPSAQPEKCTDKRTETHSCDSISRQAAIEAINTWDKFGVDGRGRLVRWQEGLVIYVRLQDVLTAIVNLPSAQPERKTGEWIEFDSSEDKYDVIKCPCCKHTFTVDSYHWTDIGFIKDDFKFCPNCGAKMKGEQNG